MLFTSRLNQTAAKFGEHAPMAAVCCNACRTCMTTNVIGVAVAGLGAAGLGVVTFAKRLARR